MGLILFTDGNNKYMEMGFILQEYMSRDEQWTLGIFLLLSGIICLVLTAFYPWPFIGKVQCVTCHKNRTRNRNEEKLAICDECEEKAWKQELIDKVKDEPTLTCPVDGSTMDKLVLSETEIVVDQCPKCKGTWLNQKETRELEEALDQPESGGSFSSGMILGMNLGRIG